MAARASSGLTPNPLVLSSRLPEIALLLSGRDLKMNPAEYIDPARYFFCRRGYRGGGSVFRRGKLIIIRG